LCRRFHGSPNSEKGSPQRPIHPLGLLCVCVYCNNPMRVCVCVYIYEYIIKGVESKKEKKNRRKERMECLCCCWSLNPGYIILTRPLDVWRDFLRFCSQTSLTHRHLYCCLALLRASTSGPEFRFLCASERTRERERDTVASTLCVAAAVMWGE
jgi:hypothetical protein